MWPRFFGAVIVLLPKASIHFGSAVDFPSIVDADDVAYFAHTYDLDGLHWALEGTFNLSHRVHGDNGVRPLLESQVARGSGSHYSSAYKLKMDLEQAQYIADGGEGAIPQDTRDYFKTVVTPILKDTLARVPPVEDLSASGGLYPFGTLDRASGIGSVYNRALYMPEYPELPHSDDYFGEGGKDVVGVTARWFTASPRLVVIDDLLSSKALSEVRSLLAESTVFYQTKMPEKFGGYVGAYIDDGLHQRLLLGLSFALHKQYPLIFKRHDLRYMWAYKYAPGMGGIKIHADEAAVNVNIWVTPDDANVNPESGGLVVFTTKPKEGWDFEKYNTDTARVVDEILKPAGFQNVTVPYKANRAVLFDSMLFHHTDHYDFVPSGGPTKRRINLTLLYGHQQPYCDPSDEKSR